jgi:hypothetical protein
VQRSENKLENLRPQHFVDALLVRPVDPAADKVLLENLTDEAGAFYIVHVVREDNGVLRLQRTIWFSRVNLEISRQMLFDAAGNILTDARYSEWKPTTRPPSPSTLRSTARRTNTAWSSTS